MTASVDAHIAWGPSGDASLAWTVGTSELRAREVFVGFAFETMGRTYFATVDPHGTKRW